MDLSPMLATLADAPLQSKLLVYEPKYDGIRAIVEILPRPRAKEPDVRIWSRNGNEKTSQFPTIVQALQTAARGLKGATVLDGEIVALDGRGRPAGFQRLQGRMHLLGAEDVKRAEREQPAALIVFDLLRENAADLTRLPLTERRKRLEAVISGRSNATIRLSEQVAGDGREMYERAMKEGWEGLIVKEASSTYQPGRRTPAWRKKKLLKEEEFVIGGWTEPRETRQHFGALLLGYYDSGRLVYAGHTGTGFDQKELARLAKLLRARKTETSPFSEKIKTNEPAHWVRPDLVAQIRFTEWTSDQKLRHPVYLGLRDDKDAKDVRRDLQVAPGFSPETTEVTETISAAKDAALTSVIDQLEALEAAKKDGLIDLPGGTRVKVTNLAKTFWPPLRAGSGSAPEPAITKGELLRYYVEVSPLILPCVANRPMVMKRFPNGIGQPAFYQHKVAERGATQFVGGSLQTLLEMTQLAAISQDPWFSRVPSSDDADYAALDLDPTDTATFATVLDVARWVRDELAKLKVPGFPKTSGASGLHIYIPLPPQTSYESGMLFCQIVATMVATKHPRQATVERAVKKRPRGSVYVDFLQNIEGKTLATAYSARASAFAGVSTPLAWKEVDAGVDPRDFTIRTAPARFAKVGDLWEGLRTAKPADLAAVIRK